MTLSSTFQFWLSRTCCQAVEFDDEPPAEPGGGEPGSCPLAVKVGRASPMSSIQVTIRAWIKGPSSHRVGKKKTKNPQPYLRHNRYRF